MNDEPQLKEVKVFAPATVANVTCGFDVMGFALEKPGDEVIARRSTQPGLQITSITGDGGMLPTDIEKNTAGVAVQKLLEHLKVDTGIELEINKKMPLGSGLGSSAASSVGGVVAVNHLLGSPLNPNELLPFAAEGERVACGSPHQDNVAPSLLGGFILIRSQNPPDLVGLECPKPLFASVIYPHIEVRTEDTRRILRKEVLLSKAVHQWANVGGLVAGLLKGDYGLISRSLEDVILEPIRSVLIPGFGEVKEAAINAGALGGGISGSGPSIFALSKTNETATEAAKAMQRVFSSLGLKSDTYVSKINTLGCQIISEQPA